MYDAYQGIAEFSLVARIAMALLEDLASDMDKYPPHHDPDEAGQLNRAFRILFRRIVCLIVSPSDGLAWVVTWILTRIACHRLAEVKLSEGQASFLLCLEPASRDNSTRFLILTTDEEFLHLLQYEGLDAKQF